jgi:S-adenosylmethionine:tRNA ribosyltransferase-isomerase
MDESTLFPGSLLISDYGYFLPDDKIARYPLEHRDLSKLLVWKKGRIEDSSFQQLSKFLPSPSLLVLNNSRVVEARLLFQKPSGGEIEIFCLEPHASISSIHLAIMQTGKVLWTCLIGGASKWKHGQVLVKKVGETRLEARFVEKRADDFTIEFSWTPAEIPFADVLHQMGLVPLPPYLKRSPTVTDRERYQTVYAREPGSVAAPTAGLHITEALLKELSLKNIEPIYLTLHVGAGTFMPVKTEDISQHQMHEEFIEVDVETIKNLITKINDPVIAVGTTSLRTLESLYWLGLKVSQDRQISVSALHLDQWFPYRQSALIPAKEALQFLLEWIEQRHEKKLVTRTQLFIVPGYSFQMVHGLITNFHQPHSTLLLLVAALIGPTWKSVYTWALQNEYRFLSYGDGCLFLP